METKLHSQSDEHFKRKTFPQPLAGHCGQGGLSAAGVKGMQSEIKIIFYRLLIEYRMMSS